MFHYKILIFTKLRNPIRETRVLKLVFITIPCLKFWALVYIVYTFRVNKYLGHCGDLARPRKHFLNKTWWVDSESIHWVVQTGRYD